jgi:hypothetical protein
MLADVLATHKSNGEYRYHDLLYPRYTETGRTLSLHSELLRSKQPEEVAGARHVLRFAKQNGWQIKVVPLPPPAEKSAP